MGYRSPPRPAPLVVVSSAVTALDRETGEIVWQYPLPQTARRFLLHEQWVVVLDRGGTLHRLELASGRPARPAPTGLQGANAFLFDGERFYVTNDDTVVALDWDGHELWRRGVPMLRGFGLGGMAVPGIVVQPDHST